MYREEITCFNIGSLPFRRGVFKGHRRRRCMSSKRSFEPVGFPYYTSYHQRLDVFWSLLLVRRSSRGGARSIRLCVMAAAAAAASSGSFVKLFRMYVPVVYLLRGSIFTE